MFKYEENVSLCVTIGFTKLKAIKLSYVVITSTFIQQFRLLDGELNWTGFQKTIYC